MHTQSVRHFICCKNQNEIAPVVTRPKGTKFKRLIREHWVSPSQWTPTICVIKESQLTLFVLIYETHTYKASAQTRHQSRCCTEWRLSFRRLRPHLLTRWSRKQGREHKYRRNIEARSRNHCCCGNAGSITYSESVFAALVVKNAIRMRRIMSSSVAWLAVPYFSTLSHKRHSYRKKRHSYRKKSVEHKVCVLIFSTAFVWNVSYYEDNSARYYDKCAHTFT
jgi:hypothetical protein